MSTGAFSGQTRRLATGPVVMRKTPRLSKSQYERLAAFRYALRRFIRFSEQEAHRHGITPQQHQVLLAIKGFPGRDRATVGELAERLQLLHHSVVGLVDRLVSDGLVARSPSVQDRRQVFVELTARGEGILEELSAAHQSQLKQIGPDLHELLRHFAGTEQTFADPVLGGPLEPEV